MSVWPWYRRPITWVAALFLLGIARLAINDGPVGAMLSALSALCAVSLVASVISKARMSGSTPMSVLAWTSGLLFLGGVAFLATQDQYSAEIGGAAPATLGVIGLVALSLSAPRPDLPSRPRVVR